MNKKDARNIFLIKFKLQGTNYFDKNVEMRVISEVFFCHKVLQTSSNLFMN